MRDDDCSVLDGSGDQIGPICRVRNAVVRRDRSGDLPGG